MRIDARAWLIVTGASLLAGHAGGQTAALPRNAPAQQPARSACFRGTTRERCMWFPLIEFAAAAGPPTSRRRPPFNLSATSPAESQRPSLPGLSVFVGLGLGDLAAVSAQLEVVRLDAYGSTDATAFFGLRCGSYAGLVAGPTTALFTSWVRRSSN